ncbi:L,D-transpeptidase [Isorropodon fossajaponicum symbiont]|uniref:L,D-transpeptidase n=1 Tax=Isorropodon fossajaponicum symbiont TaxID=883811 RepID=UPI00315B2395
MINININTQTLDYYQDNVLQKSYSISSSINGVGEVEGSFCTPTGRFKISEKIGDNVELGTVFIARIPTGEIYSKQLFNEQTDKDWILTRILWLDGVEKHNKNTHERYIYIHGAHLMNL